MNYIKKYLSLVHKLRNSEHFDFYKYCVDLILPLIASIPALAPLFNIFYSLFQKEDEIFKRSRKAEETEFIHEAYMKMRNVFMFIKHIVEGASYSDDANEKAAAAKLGLVIENYKTIPSVAMNEASALVFNMVQDLRLQKNASAVTTLDLATQTDKLEEANDTFRELYFARAGEQETISGQGNMKEIRPQVEDSFDVVLNTANGLYIAAVKSGNMALAVILKKIIDGVNAVITQYEYIYARRSPGTIPDKEKPGDDTTDPDNPALPGDGVPVFAVNAQTVAFVENDGGPRMVVVLSDAPVLAALLPDLTGAVLMLREETDDVSFPIEGYATENAGDTEQTTGLRVSGNAGRWFDSPFRAKGPASARIEVDGVVIAHLTGMLYPETFVN
ncbi:MAG: DUF6261 family protein [Tannerellaceae bacterium]|jgi:hypothetical protein|nr:DUF6261 family protein [Tannerellaceae bacterium]